MAVIVSVLRPRSAHIRHSLPDLLHRHLEVEVWVDQLAACFDLKDAQRTWEAEEVAWMSGIEIDFVVVIVRSSSVALVAL